MPVLLRYCRAARVHGGDDDAAVDEVDDRVGGGCGLVSEVAHELGGGRAPVDEQERNGDREQRDGEAEHVAEVVPGIG